MPRPLYDGGILCANCTRRFGGQSARVGSACRSQTGGVTLAALGATRCDLLMTTKDSCKNNFGFGDKLTLTPGPVQWNQTPGVRIPPLPLLPPREERAGERRVVGGTRKPLSPFVPHVEREKIGFSPQPCLIQWQCTRPFPIGCIGWERENCPPSAGLSNRLGSCERRVWVFPLPSDGRVRVRSFCLKYASCPGLVLAQTRSFAAWHSFAFEWRHVINS